MKYETYDDQYEQTEQPGSTTTPNGHRISPEIKGRSESPEDESPLPLVSPKIERCSPPLSSPPGMGYCPEFVNRGGLSIRPIPMKTLTSRDFLSRDDRENFPRPPVGFYGTMENSRPVDFRVPPPPPSSVVSSSTCSPPMMRPPPPPPPLKHRMEMKHPVHHPTSHPGHEEPTSSMPDLGKIFGVSSLLFQ